MAGLATLHVKQVPPDYFARTPSQAKGSLSLDVCYVSVQISGRMVTLAVDLKDWIVGISDCSTDSFVTVSPFWEIIARKQKDVFCKVSNI